MPRSIVIALSFGIVIISLIFFILNYRLQKLSRLEACLSPGVIKVLNKAYTTRTVIILGDSRVSRWESPQFGKGLDIIKIGLPGVTSFEVKCALEKICLHNYADLYIVNLGVNDLVAASMLPAAQRKITEILISENLHYIANKLASGGSQVILMTIVPPIDLGIMRKAVWGRNIEQSAREVSTAILDKRSSKYILMIDLSELFYNVINQEWNKDYSVDSVHWNDMAYKEINKLVQEVLQKE